MTDSLYNKIEISKIEPDFHIKLYLLILNLAAFYFVCTFQIFTVVDDLVRMLGKGAELVRR